MRLIEASNSAIEAEFSANQLKIAENSLSFRCFSRERRLIAIDARACKIEPEDKG
jgi:hypothetical protein